jgi:hypothetical protein
MVWYGFILSFFGYLWDLLIDWLTTIFIIPFKNTDMLWLLVPVWLAWLFAEFFQEKRGTSLGNAISNAVIILWGSIDCARQTTYWIVKHPAANFWDISLRYFLIILIFAYGGLILWFGFKARDIAKKIGRIREITYVFVMFVPIFYGAINLSLNHIIAAIIYFPIFYYFIEMLDRIIPDPKAVEADEKNSNSMIGSLPNHESMINQSASNYSHNQSTQNQNTQGSSYNQYGSNNQSYSQNKPNQNQYPQYQKKF